MHTRKGGSTSRAEVVDKLPAPLVDLFRVPADRPEPKPSEGCAKDDAAQKVGLSVPAPAGAHATKDASTILEYYSYIEGDLPRFCRKLFQNSLR